MAVTAPVCRLVCGFLGYDGAQGNPVISTLPAALRLSIEESGGAEWIRSTFQYAADEVAAGRPGSETVLAKLSELLFVEAVRRYCRDPARGPDRLARRSARSATSHGHWPCCIAT